MADEQLGDVQLAAQRMGHARLAQQRAAFAHAVHIDVDLVGFAELGKQHAGGVLRHIGEIHRQPQARGQFFGVAHAVLGGQFIGVGAPAGDGLLCQVAALVVGEFAVERLAREGVQRPVLLRDAAQILNDHAHGAHGIVRALAVAGALLAEQPVGNGFEQFFEPFLGHGVPLL